MNSAGAGGSPAPGGPTIRKVPGPASKTLPRSPVKKKPLQPAPAAWTLPNSPFMTAPGHRPPKSDKPLEILKIFNPMYSPAVDGSSSGDESSLPPTATTTTERIFIGKSRTTCLLCSDPVLIDVVVKREDETGGGGSSGKESGVGSSAGSSTTGVGVGPSVLKRLKEVKDLCYHLQFSQKDIPRQYTEELFPFCSACQELVERISTSHQVIEEEKRKIAGSIQEIERKVVDAELLRSRTSSYTTNSEEKRFLKLREVVLDGYHNKLLMKKKVRESILMDSNNLSLSELGPGQSPVPPTALTTLKNEDLDHGHQQPPIEPTPTPVNGTNGHEQEKNIPDESDLAAVLSPDNFIPNCDVAEPVENEMLFSNEEESLASHSVDMEFSGEAEYDDDDLFEPINPRSRMMVNSGTCSNGQESHDNGMNGEHEDYSNSNEPTLEITDVRSMQVDVTTIKQQPPSPPEADDSNDNADNDSYMEFETQQSPSKRRRSIYKGVDIYRISTNIPDDKGCLQCSACGYTVEILDTHIQENTAYQAIISHINNVHRKPSETSKKKSANHRAAESPKPTSSTKSAKVSVQQGERKFVCSVCPARFRNMKSLVQHRKLKNHSASPTPSPAQRSRKSRTNISEDDSEMCDCDICGRTVLYGRYLSHRFTHYNLKEKVQAITNNERGAPPRTSKVFKGLRAQLAVVERMESLKPLIRERSPKKKTR